MPVLLILLLLFQVPKPSVETLERRHERNTPFYPHPPDPKHLQSVSTSIAFKREKKFLFIRYKESLNSNKVRIEQKRSKDGWYLCGYQRLDAYGKLVSSVEIDPTWRNPTVLLVVLLDEFDKEVATAEVQADSKKLLAGELLTAEAVFR